MVNKIIFAGQETSKDDLEFKRISIEIFEKITNATLLDGYFVAEKIDGNIIINEKKLANISTTLFCQMIETLGEEGQVFLDKIREGNITNLGMDFIAYILEQGFMTQKAFHYMRAIGLGVFQMSLLEKINEIRDITYSTSELFNLAMRKKLGTAFTKEELIRLMIED